MENMYTIVKMNGDEGCTEDLHINCFVSRTNPPKKNYHGEFFCKIVRTYRTKEGGTMYVIEPLINCGYQYLSQLLWLTRALNGEIDIDSKYMKKLNSLLLKDELEFLALPKEIGREQLEGMDRKAIQSIFSIIKSKVRALEEKPNELYNLIEEIVFKLD